MFVFLFCYLCVCIESITLSRSVCIRGWGIFLRVCALVIFAAIVSIVLALLFVRVYFLLLFINLLCRTWKWKHYLTCIETNTFACFFNLTWWQFRNFFCVRLSDLNIISLFITLTCYNWQNTSRVHIERKFCMFCLSLGKYIRFWFYLFAAKAFNFVKRCEISACFSTSENNSKHRG